MGTGTQPNPEPKTIFPWAHGMYKPRGHRVYYYPDYPEHAGRILHAEVPNNNEAYNLAESLNKKTRDTCREFEKNPSVTAQQLQSEFANLQKQIDSKLDAYVAQAKKATAEFDAMVPLMDRMQAMLSQRGKLRRLMDTAKLPTWTQWFEAFRERLEEDVTIRTIQRKLREYRGGKKPTPSKRTSHIDGELLSAVQDTVAKASGLAKWIVQEAAKPKGKGIPVPEDWQDRAKTIVESAEPQFRELLLRRHDPFGVRLPAGEILVVGKRKYRVADGLTPQRVTPTKTKGMYRITLLVRDAELVTRKLRKRETCPECHYTLDVIDGRFPKHNYMPGPNYGKDCRMSTQKVTLDERGKVINSAEEAKTTTA